METTIEQEVPEGRYTKFEGSWCVVCDPDDLKRGDRIIAVTKAGKRHDMTVVKKVGSNEYGAVYLTKWSPPNTYAMWVNRDNTFCLHVPNGYNAGDEIKVKKANGEIKIEFLNVHIEGNYWFARSQKGLCSECGEKGTMGTQCMLCNEGHYS